MKDHLPRKVISGNFFYWKSTIGTTIVANEVNIDMYCLQKRIKTFPLALYFQFWDIYTSIKTIRGVSFSQKIKNVFSNSSVNLIFYNLTERTLVTCRSDQ